MSSRLTHSPSAIVAALLIQGNQCADPTILPLGAFPIYDTGEPDRPDSVVTIRDTAGQGDGRDMNSGELNQHYGLQIRVRAKDKVTASFQTQVLRSWLSESVYAAHVTIATSVYLVQCLVKFGQVLVIGTDAPSTKRWVCTLNFLAALKQLS